MSQLQQSESLSPHPSKPPLNSAVLKWPVFIPLSLMILSLVLGGCQKSSANNQYTIKKISDGDTLSATDAKGQEVKVRFACVDAPEVPHSKKEKQSKKAVDQNQFKWGLKAQLRLQQLVEKGGDRVLLTITDRDQYGRKVSEVRLPDGTFIQEVLVREGLAMVYRPYVKNCPSVQLIEQAEAQAKKSKRGVWGDPKFVPAWEYRRTGKS